MKRTTRAGRSATHVLLGAILVAGCTKEAGTKRSLDGGGMPQVMAPEKALPPGLTPLAAAQLDSGNVAFRAQRYDEALKFYRAASNTVPEHASPWYGIYMVAQATGNQGLADSASRAVSRRDTGGELQDTGVAKAHRTDPGAPHPRGSVPD
jgi:hypothetical protein